jgi:hypothetical protein
MNPYGMKKHPAEGGRIHIQKYKNAPRLVGRFSGARQLLCRLRTDSVPDLGANVIVHGQVMRLSAMLLCLAKNLVLAFAASLPVAALRTNI